MSVGTFYFFLFLVIGGGVWAFLMRARRGDPGKSFNKVQEEKKQGVKPVVKRDIIGVPIVADDGRVVRLDEADSAPESAGTEEVSEEAENQDAEQ